MKKKVLAIMLATLMSATMFAGMATVTAEEDEYLKEVKEHVTPEQWVEIEELIGKYEKSRSLPDLTFEDNTFQKTGDDTLKAQAYNEGPIASLPCSVLFETDEDEDDDWESVGRYWIWLGLRSGQKKWTESNEITDTGQIKCRATINPSGNVPESDYDNNQVEDTFTFS
jgi:hypothetical protein